uniref:Uncharacterized protein n=1 Tax=Arundo donax TaxID=35708 RepID=A0A0A9FM98_ARUDO
MVLMQEIRYFFWLDIVTLSAVFSMPLVAAKHSHRFCSYKKRKVKHCLSFAASPLRLCVDQ